MNFNPASPCPWVLNQGRPTNVEAPTWLRCLLFRLPSLVTACVLLPLDGGTKQREMRGSSCSDLPGLSASVGYLGRIEMQREENTGFRLTHHW